MLLSTRLYQLPDPLHDMAESSEEVYFDDLLRLLSLLALAVGEQINGPKHQADQAGQRKADQFGGGALEEGVAVAVAHAHEALDGEQERVGDQGAEGHATRRGQRVVQRGPVDRGASVDSWRRVGDVDQEVDRVHQQQIGQLDLEGRELPRFCGQHGGDDQNTSCGVHGAENYVPKGCDDLERCGTGVIGRRIGNVHGWKGDINLFLLIFTLILTG